METFGEIEPETNEEVADGVGLENVDCANCIGVLARELSDGVVARKSPKGTLEYGSMMTGIFGCDSTAGVLIGVAIAAGSCARPSATTGVFGRVSVAEEAVLLPKC